MGTFYTASWTSQLHIVTPHDLLGTYITAPYCTAPFRVHMELSQWFYLYVIELPWYFLCDVPVFVPDSWLRYRWYPLIQLVSNFTHHTPAVRLGLPENMDWNVLSCLREFSSWWLALKFIVHKKILSQSKWTVVVGLSYGNYFQISPDKHLLPPTWWISSQ